MKNNQSSSNYALRARHMIFVLLLSSIALQAGASTYAAQSADKIFRQAVKAMGGERALRRIKAWQITGTITRQRDNASGNYRAAAMQPDLYVSNWRLDGFESGAGFTGKSSWRADSHNGLRTLTGDASDDFQAEASYRNRLWLDYRKQRAGITYIGITTVNNKAAQAVTLTTLRGVKIKLYFDSASCLLVKEEMTTGEARKTIEYADYHAVDGVMEPFSMILYEEGESYTIRIERVVHNPQLDISLFNFPRNTDEPLPDMETLLAQVRSHQQELDQLREKYGYTETTTSYQFDKHGSLEEKESETHEFTFFRGYRIRRLVAKNGQPLPVRDQAKEDRRIEKMIRDLEQGKKPDVPYNQRRLRLSDMLRVSQFANSRRERFRQRDMIVVDFEPNPNFKPDNLDDRFIHKLAGSIWIDTADLQIARVEFLLIDTFKVGGGLFFAMKPGSRFVTEQNRFNDEIWLPAFTEVTINARAMIFAGFGIIQKITYGNYLRFDVKAEEKLKPPSNAKPDDL